MANDKKYVFIRNATAAAVAVSVFFIVAVLYIALPKLPVYGQNASVKEPSKFFAAASSTDGGEKTAVLPEPTVSPVDLEDFERKPQLPDETKISLIFLRAAAAENSRLQYTVAWAFGGKSQRGWFLYAPLIQQTVGAKQYDAASPDFARALLDWQTRFGLAPNATLDDKTLYKLVEFWQARRLKNSDYPSPDKLLTAPIADFYDPTRAPDLLKVERETYAAYKRMVAAAAKDKSLNLKLTRTGELAPEEKFLKIVSAFRSREYQEKLRRESPNSGRAGLATNSPHFTGRALDIYVGGEPVTTKDFNRAAQIQTPAYKWLVKNAERFGFCNYFYEPWHWEYIPEHLRKTNAPVK